MKIDLLKLIRFLLKRCWLMILFCVIAAGGMYAYLTKTSVDTYTASATMYVYNGNPNVVNYQYTNTSDLNSAVQLLDTYMVVIKSNKVMDAVAERLGATYPGISTSFIARTLSMGSVSQTGVMMVCSTTTDAQLSADICNAVMDAAPSEIIRVVSAGSIEIIDYAQTPLAPNSKGILKKAVLAGLAGAVLAGGLLVLLFLLNNKVTEERELTDNYTLPILSAIPRKGKGEGDPREFLNDTDTPVTTLEAYGKLRMNLGFTLVNRRKIVMVSSSVPGEGKSTITANLAISWAASGKHVLLIDADMRKANQTHIFGIGKDRWGLSDLLVGDPELEDVICRNVREGLDLMPVGHIPPNPSELLNSAAMRGLLAHLESSYDIILMDMPPVNVVTDPLVLSDEEIGMMFVVRQDYSDHREIRKALMAAEFTGINLLGFVFYGDRVTSGYYHSKYYNKYYGDYQKNNTDKRHARRPEA